MKTIRYCTNCQAPTRDKYLQICPICGDQLMDIPDENLIVDENLLESKMRELEGKINSTNSTMLDFQRFMNDESVKRKSNILTIETLIVIGCIAVLAFMMGAIVASSICWGYFS